ncbi:MAG: ATPase [Lachnospiraceae bacterium]
MEQVLKRLSEIESAATAIMEQADVRKKELSQKMERKTAEFDQKVAQETAATIDDLRQQLHLQIESELLQQQKQTDGLLKYLDEQYNKDHTKIAQQILEQLIKE